MTEEQLIAFAEQHAENTLQNHWNNAYMWYSYLEDGVLTEEELDWILGNTSFNVSVW